MSSAVRISAMSVELKCTVLSSATGRSMRSSLCEANQGFRVCALALTAPVNTFLTVEGAPLLKEQNISTLPKCTGTFPLKKGFG